MTWGARALACWALAQQANGGADYWYWFKEATSYKHEAVEHAGWSSWPRRRDPASAPRRSVILPGTRPGSLGTRWRPADCRSARSGVPDEVLQGHQGSVEPEALAEALPLFGWSISRVWWPSRSTANSCRASFDTWCLPRSPSASTSVTGARARRSTCTSTRPTQTTSSMTSVCTSYR